MSGSPCRARCSVCPSAGSNRTYAPQSTPRLLLHGGGGLNFSHIAAAFREGTEHLVDVLLVAAATSHAAPARRTPASSPVLHMLAILPYASWLLGSRRGELAQHWSRMAAAADELRSNVHFQQGELFLLVLGGGQDLRILGPRLLAELRDAPNLILACTDPATLQQANGSFLAAAKRAVTLPTVHAHSSAMVPRRGGMSPRTGIYLFSPSALPPLSKGALSGHERLRLLVREATAAAMNTSRLAESLETAALCVVPPGLEPWGAPLLASFAAGCVPVIAGLAANRYVRQLPFGASLDYRNATLQLLTLQLFTRRVSAHCKKGDSSWLASWLLSPELERLREVNGVRCGRYLTWRS